MKVKEYLLINKQKIKKEFIITIVLLMIAYFALPRVAYHFFGYYDDGIKYERVELSGDYTGNFNELDSDGISLKLSSKSEDIYSYNEERVNGVNSIEKNEHLVIFSVDSSLYEIDYTDDYNSIYFYNSSSLNEYLFKLYEKDNKLPLFYIPTYKGLLSQFSHLTIRTISFPTVISKYTTYQNEKYAFGISFGEPENDTDTRVKLAVQIYEKQAKYKQIADITIFRNLGDEVKPFTLEEILFIVKSINIT